MSQQLIIHLLILAWKSQLHTRLVQQEEFLWWAVWVKRKDHCLAGETCRIVDSNEELPSVSALYGNLPTLTAQSKLNADNVVYVVHTGALWSHHLSLITWCKIRSKFGRLWELAWYSHCVVGILMHCYMMLCFHIPWHSLVEPPNIKSGGAGAPPAPSPPPPPSISSPLYWAFRGLWECKTLSCNATYSIVLLSGRDD